MRLSPEMSKSHLCDTSRFIPATEKMITEVKKSLLKLYQQRIKSYDEILDAQGQVKPYWKKLFENLEKLGINELEVRNQEVINKLRENGVTYNVYGTPDEMSRPWRLDPIPFLLEKKEWDDISKGLKQRATLLDLMLKDIYGSQLLIKNGIIPAELVYDNSGFFRPCFDVKIAAEKQLLMYAADIARGPDGRMWIVDNRTQAPSGSGYAVENRSVMSKILPELTDGMFVSRLSPFFTSLHQQVIALSHKQNPCIVYLTPGSRNETYFEHAYLAASLGYTLVQGDDLMVRDGFVWLKSIEGLEKVDVIIRRVDDEWCDPLELREDSRLGVPGLLQAARSGNVCIINPPGSSVLENSALLAFMAPACRFLLNEELLLPSIATWWCGQPNELQFVLDNLPKLIVKKANRKQVFRSKFGSSLSEQALEDLKKSILQAPHEYVAQEEISLSTTPSLVNGELEPRLAAIRVFLVAHDNDYQVMQGGLTRSSAEKDRFAVSNQHGGVSKDTWIISDALPAQQERMVLNRHDFNNPHTSLPSRSAESLFWIGRYGERVMALAKLLQIIINVLQERRRFAGALKVEQLDILLQSLTHLTLTYPGFLIEDKEEMLKNPYPELQSLVYDSYKMGSVASSLTSLVNNLIAVSDKWNYDTWRVIYQIKNSLNKIKHPEKSELTKANNMQKVLEKLSNRIFTFYGIVTETMPRESGLYVLETGKLIERILSKISVLRTIFTFKNEAHIENDLIELVLINHHLLVQYRQIYKSHFSLDSMLDMVLLGQNLPYSLAYQLDTLGTYVSKLPKTTQPNRLNQAEKAVLEASTKVKLADINELVSTAPDSTFRATLDKLLADVFQHISDVTNHLTDLYFTHTEIQHALLGIIENTATHEI